MRHYFILLYAVLLITASFAADVNAQAANARTHVEAARAAIAPKVANPKAQYHIFKGLFDQICAEPKLPDQMRVEDRSAVVPRKDWFAWPRNIFDQLYFIGTKTAGVWGINTPDGVIVIDTNFHYNGTELMMNLLSYGVDPNNIKYVLITHAHDDRYWGAKAIQEKYPSARIGMSAADWDVVAKDNSPAQFKPRKDLVITDGQKITLGGITVTAYITPGHTPGTLSFIIGPLTNRHSVASDENQHFASIWGGVDIGLGRQGVQYWPDGVTMMKTYISSLRRFIDLQKQAGVDVILSTTLRHANMAEKMHIWKALNPDAAGDLSEHMKFVGESHPFISKEAVDRFNTILLECYEANLAWRNGS
jgi:glyoxylase-like metal-dependent hydrolase (beta-lactamase superfamily II)